MASNVIVMPRTLALADLERSGLDEKDFKKLKLQALTGEQTYELTQKFKARAVKFPYLDTAARDTGFFRLRFLEDVKAFGAKKVQRYWQPSDTEPRAYFSPHINWKKTLETEADVWITEGEKKAAAACKAGIPCIGLGGIWSWRSKAKGQSFIQDLARITWKRGIKICYDTETEENPLIVGAMESLAHQLELRGGKVQFIDLPLLDAGGKTGLDDFLVARSVEELGKIEGRSPTSNTIFLKLNEELAVIENPVGVLHVPSQQLFGTPAALSEIMYGKMRVSTMDAAGRLVEKPAVKEWLQWPHHRRFKKIVFEPGQPAVIADALNIWRERPIKPRRGDVTLLKKLLDYVFAREPASREWFLQWAAYPLQHPGTKQYAAVVLWSADTGTGKSLLANTLGRIYGSDSFKVLTQYELHSPYNGWQENCEFVLGEEIASNEKKLDADRLKHMITGETTIINQKYRVPYVVRNCANFIFTSNHPDAFIIDRHDRRYFVHEVGANAEKPSEAWFTKVYDPWFKSDEGAAAIYQYLLGVNLDSFNPRGRALVTSAKLAMVATSGGEADVLVRELLANPDQFCRVMDGPPAARDLYTTQELQRFIDPDNAHRVSLSALGRALRRAGLPDPENTNTKRNGSCRLWPIRNLEKWKTASHAERKKNYDGEES